jgi:hypothetical protein
MLSAKVIYDNGEAVSLRANENQFDESFPAECLLISGGATFNLRLGQQVLTDKHLRRLFRIHIQPKEMQYAGACGRGFTNTGAGEDGPMPRGGGSRCRRTSTSGGYFGYVC